jgi:hypothetical protein
LPTEMKLDKIMSSPVITIMSCHKYFAYWNEVR